MKKRSILIVIPRIPIPTFSGERIRSVHNIKALNEVYDVRLVAISESLPTEEAIAFLEENTSSYKIFVKRGVLCRLNTLKSIVNGLPMQVNYFYFKDIQEYILNMADKSDLVFCSLARTAEYAKNINKPKIVDITDSLAVNYKRSGRQVRSWFWKMLYFMESRKMFRYEREIVSVFDKSLLVNTEEIEFLGSEKRLVWAPQCAQGRLLQLNSKHPEKNNNVVFFGKMDYPPNVDAVLWFCENVLPFVNPEIELKVIGARPIRKIKDLENKYKNVTVTGYVDDPYDVIASSLCAVAPMFTGSGMQTKVLEAMAVGSIAVTTSLSARPIKGAHDGKELLVEDDPSRMAELINDIYAHPKKFSEIRRNAKKFIGENFTWEIYSKNITALVEEVISGRLMTDKNNRK